MKEPSHWVETSLPPGDHELVVPRQDMVIEYHGYLSFTPDSFFLPERCEVVDLMCNVADSFAGVDYVAIDLGTWKYVPPADDGGWLVGQAAWDGRDVYVEGNTLSFCLSAPTLEGSKDEEDWIPIDWIEIKLTILPLWQRF